MLLADVTGAAFLLLAVVSPVQCVCRTRQVPMTQVVRGSLFASLD